MILGANANGTPLAGPFVAWTSGLHAKHTGSEGSQPRGFLRLFLRSLIFRRAVGNRKREFPVF